MNVDSHLDKIRRMEALRARLHPLDDFPLWFWSAMNAGTHAVNAALHEAGVTRPDDVFPTQPGVYLVPRAGGEPCPAYCPLGDVLHVGRPKIEAPVPDDIAAMMHEMETIEHHRDPCVRGEREPTQAIVDECDAALGRCLQLLTLRLQRGRA
ncbi:MAG: hypothetical protein AB7L76_12110 [Burkholderiaceae bacterium]